MTRTQIEGRRELPLTADWQIVRFDQSHIPDAVRLSQQARWPHRAEDWALTSSVSRGFVALCRGRVVGTALCTVFGRVALLNMVIVDKRMRGKGLGRALMHRVIESAGTREMRLVATSDGLPLYEKLGFVARSRIFQHQGMAVAAKPVRPVRSGDVGDLEMMAAMDFAASGMERTPLLKRIAEVGEVLLAENGFALMRAFGRGRVIGPVVAVDRETAHALIAEGASRAAGSFLRIDLTEVHALDGFATECGLAAQGGGTVMTKGPGPGAAHGMQTYALVSQALG
jgi:GNAT superfamily N-acetyltransferase